MFGADTFCTRIGNQDRPRATRTGIVAKDEPRQEENLGPGNLFLLTGGGHIDVSPLGESSVVREFHEVVLPR